MASLAMMGHFTAIMLRLHRAMDARTVKVMALINDSKLAATRTHSNPITLVGVDNSLANWLYAIAAMVDKKVATIDTTIESDDITTVTAKLHCK